MSNVQNCKSALGELLSQAKLNKEVGVFREYTVSVKNWHAKTECAQYNLSLEANKANKVVIDAFCDLKFPTRDCDVGHISTFIQSSIQTWADFKEVTKDEVFEVFYVDTTILGFKSSAAMLSTVSHIAGRMSASPAKTCAIIMAPNTGPYGDEYSAEGPVKSMQEWENDLRDVDRRMGSFGPSFEVLGLGVKRVHCVNQGT